MPRVGFEPTISAGERPKTYALDRAATGTALYCIYYVLYNIVHTRLFVTKAQGRLLGIRKLS